MASGAGTTDAAAWQSSRRGRSATSVEPIQAPKRGSTSEHAVARLHASSLRLVLFGVALLLAVRPFLGWLSRVYTIKAHRVIVRSCLLIRHRHKFQLIS